MDLYEKQKELQNSSYTLLEERIKQISKKGQAKDLAEASGMLGYVQKLIAQIDRFKEKYLQEVLGKVIQEDNEYYAKLLGVEYKNIHDAIAKPLAIMLLSKQRKDEAFELLQQSKQKFKEMPTNELRERVEKLVDYAQKRIGLEGEFYITLGRNEGKDFLKEMPHRVALAIWQISSNDLAVMLMGHLLSLKNIDDAEADNTGNTRQTFGGEIGSTAHQRVAWRFLRDVEKLEADALKKAYRAYDNNHFENIEQLLSPLWSNVVELEVGQKLIDLAQEAEIIGEYSKVNDEKGFNYLKLDKTFLEKMNNTDKKLAHSASMTYKPMVTVPLDWEEMYGGGFLPDEGEKSRFDLSLIKASSRKDREALEGKIIPKPILNAINQMQKTAFCINEKMLEVLLDYHGDINYLKKENRVDFAYYRILRELFSSGKEHDSKEIIYEHFKKTKFIKLKDYRLNKTDKVRIDKAIKNIKKEKDYELFKLNSNLYYDIAKYKQGFDTIVKIAQEMKDYEKFYFVWRMDFRGRVYPQQTLLNPQSGDLPKSLLLFSEKKSLNEEGKKWFFIHGANTYGEVDKEPFKNRVAWIESKHELILSCAKNHRDEKFWKEAGDPFKFLAFCFEYARYVENPNTFTTGIPIAIDGSNNGFQHITALLRDSEGAKSVNVLPYYDVDNNLEVADFYAEVAEVLKVKMQEEYDAFLNEKDNFIEKEDGLFYSIKKENNFEASYYFDKVATFLEGVSPDDLTSMQFYSTYVEQNIKKIDWGGVKFTKDDFETIENELDIIERKVRKEVGNDDLNELKYSIIDELEKLAKRAKRQFDNGKLIEKKGKVFKQEDKSTLESRSLYKKFLDKGIVKRGFVKNPVMTESYGSSAAGKAKKLLEEIEADGILSELDEDTRYLVSLQITKVLEKALTAVSDSPQKYKKWMKSYANEIGKKEEAILWNTPLGLEVQQVEFKSKKVKVSIGEGRKVEFKVYTNDLDMRSHSKGVSPNYIHSLDASHLMMTVNALAQRGINDIVTVHDSFATHANDVTTLSRTLREAFVALHKKEILPELCLFWEEVFGVEQKKIPYVDKEGFDLNEVLKSEYFFA
jgi:uncharacterized protein YihD (DUF1040 family)